MEKKNGSPVPHLNLEVIAQRISEEEKNEEKKESETTTEESNLTDTGVPTLKTYTVKEILMNFVPSQRAQTVLNSDNWT